MFVLFVNTEGVAHLKQRFAVVAKDTESTDRQINKLYLFETFLYIIVAYLSCFLLAFISRLVSKPTVSSRT